MAEIIRDLTEADLALLRSAGPRGVHPPALKRLTDTHHWIARLIAQGDQPNWQIAELTGYSQSRISILKADPTFQELVAQYRAEVGSLRSEAFANVEAKRAAFRSDLYEIGHDRLLEERDLISHRDMQEWLKLVDPPSVRSGGMNVNILNIGDQLAAGRARGEKLLAAVPAAIEARSATSYQPPPPAKAEPDER